MPKQSECKYMLEFIFFVLQLYEISFYNFTCFLNKKWGVALTQLSLQQRKILLSALHSYLNFITYAIQLNELPAFVFIYYNFSA